MNYYKIEFNPVITTAFAMFRYLVQGRYGNNAWSSDAHSFYLIATPDSSETLLEYVDPSRNKSGQLLPGASELCLLISHVSQEDSSLPTDAKEWLYKLTQTVDELSAFLQKFDKPD